ncbi:hypothetical protein EBN03_03425 [Nocardia stercoris]|uniref:Phthiocerol/phthiodiolone dimycocerosyl transferase n=1 Tax=Nocardia stercoris TaxID=2483361 RepID=A0A3M2LD71_9NOCA|nr:hypothetical protein EBN03_03425 [Nocardia stercoris]
MGTSTIAGRQVARPLSPGERWFWIIDDISPANCVARLQIRGSLPVADLERGAACLLSEYPILRTRIVTGQDGPVFEPVAEPRIPLRHYVCEDEQAWRTAVDRELRESLGPLPARIVHIAAGDRHDLILTVSHVLADFRSLLALLRKLIDYAAGAEPGPMRPPVPAADQLVSGRARTLRGYLDATVAEQLSAWRCRPQRLVGSEIPLAERRTRAIYRTLDGRMLEDLATACRSAGVTVHGALTAAVGQAVGKLVRPGGHGYAGIGSPVDFRRALDPAPEQDEVGVYAPVLSTFAPFGPGMSLWTAAAAVNRQVRQGVRRQRHLAMSAGTRFGLPKSRESGRRVAAVVDRGAPWNVSVSNVGRVDFPARVAGWELSELILATGNSCVSALTVAAVSAHERMAVTFCVVDGMLADAAIEQLADQVMDTLARMAGDLVE